MPASTPKPKYFYGWYIVAVGFLSHVACAFHMSSTLSVFLKPLTEDLAVSRGLFSLLRSGEILIGAAMAPLVGPLVDRYGGRWLMAGGALVAGAGFVWLSQVGAFWQFLFLRWVLVSAAGVFMCHMVVSVTVSRWFVRKRGRAIAIASLGQGLSKVCIPVVTAYLFVWVGLRSTWAIFGLVTLGLGLGGGWVLQELVWATYFGRLSLGMVRGLGILVTHAFGAAGAPFFGFVHDLTGSYQSSFVAFVIALAASAALSLMVRAPRKKLDRVGLTPRQDQA